MSGASGVLSVLGKVVAGLLAVVLLAYVAVNGVAWVQAQQRRGDIADRVTAELERAVPAAADRQQDVVAVAGREPDERWIEQHCDYSSDDAGWMVQSHREVCSVRSVTAWQVESGEEARGLLPVEGRAGEPNDGCESLGTADDAEVTYVDAATAEGEPFCTSSLETLGASRGLVGDPVSLDQGPWLLVVDERPLVDEPIGCLHWSVLFCDNPFGDRHAFGEAPTS